MISEPEYFRELVEYVRATVESQDRVIERVDELYRTKSEQLKEERLADPEGYFTAHFVLPAILSFHRLNIDRLPIDLADLPTCLRAESHGRAFLKDGEGKKLFLSSPAATGKKHVMSKWDIAPPPLPEKIDPANARYRDRGYKGLELWRRGSGLSKQHFSVCPDFAIASPAPYTAVGEVKIVRYSGGSWISGRPASADEVLRLIYDLVKEVIFYLGCHAPNYSSGLMIVADATGQGIVQSVLDDLHPELLEGRFGPNSGLYLIPLSLR